MDAKQRNMDCSIGTLVVWMQKQRNMYCNIGTLVVQKQCNLDCNIGSLVVWMKQLVLFASYVRLAPRSVPTSFVISQKPRVT